MALGNDCDSEIAKFYAGKTIFLTGATGFIGNLTMEKLLRTCNDLDKIYILVRTKRGKEYEKRMDELFDKASFVPLKEQYPNFREKVFIINGDLVEPNCGLSEESIQTLKNEVDVIIHCAATVRFDQSIKIATYINVRGTRDLIEIAREMKKLKAFLYVSTAFSFCPRYEIDEKFYPPPIEPKSLIGLVDVLDDEKLKAITPTIIGEWPNTYTFTKSVAEAVVMEEGQNLPMVVVRPSIVIGSLKEPVPGWTDNLYGPSGLILGGGLGLLRCVKGDSETESPLVPADYVINSMLAATYDRARQRDIDYHGSLHVQQTIPVYNYCSPAIAPVTWKKFVEESFRIALEENLSTHMIWYPNTFVTKFNFLYNIVFFFVQTIPAYLVDAVLLVMGKKLMAVALLNKITRLQEVLCYFMLRSWDFKIDNTMRLWRKLGAEDQRLFPFSMENFDWTKFTHVYMRGLRIYLLKDPIETLPEGRKHVLKLRILHYLVCAVIYLLVFGFLYYLINSSYRCMRLFTY